MTGTQEPESQVLEESCTDGVTGYDVDIRIVTGLRHSLSQVFCYKATVTFSSVLFHSMKATHSIRWMAHDPSNQLIIGF